MGAEGPAQCPEKGRLALFQRFSDKKNLRLILLPAFLSLTMRATMSRVHGVFWPKKNVDKNNVTMKISFLIGFILVHKNISAQNGTTGNFVLT